MVTKKSYQLFYFDTLQKRSNKQCSNNVTATHFKAANATFLVHVNYRLHQPHDKQKQSNEAIYYNPQTW